MTYKNLVKFIKENNNENVFDLIHPCVKSKIIFAVGKSSTNVASMLSSVMNVCEISHSRYVSAEHFELRDRFIRSNEQISIDEICRSASKIRKKSKSLISSNDLMLALALSLLDGEYIIIEMSEKYYQSIINRITFSPFAVLFCSFDDEYNANLIAQAPSSTHICALSQAPRYDYLHTENENGRKTVFASPNKLTLKSSDLLGADFYHFSYLYRLPCIDLDNLLLATLVIESATALFDTPRAYIYKGLASTTLPCDLKIFSISPTVLLKIGSDDFTLPKGFDFEKITNLVPSQRPASNTIFYGNADYIEKVKKAIR